MCMQSQLNELRRQRKKIDDMNSKCLRAAVLAAGKHSCSRMTCVRFARLHKDSGIHVICVLFGLKICMRKRK